MDITVSSAATMGAFNTGFDTVILHRPTSMRGGALGIDVASNPAGMTVPFSLV
jgi:hypothetical protein